MECEWLTTVDLLNPNHETDDYFWLRPILISLFPLFAWDIKSNLKDLFQIMVIAQFISCAHQSYKLIQLTYLYFYEGLC